MSVREQIEAMRRSRTRPAEDLSIREALRAEASDARRRSEAAKDAGAAWRALATPRLLDGVQVVGASRGVLRLRPANAAARYELRTWLASGGEAALAAACPLVKRVDIAR